MTCRRCHNASGKISNADCSELLQNCCGVSSAVKRHDVPSTCTDLLRGLRFIPEIRILATPTYQDDQQNLTLTVVAGTHKMVNQVAMFLREKGKEEACLRSG